MCDLCNLQDREKDSSNQCKNRENAT
jgi:hypothetical protein